MEMLCKSRARRLRLKIRHAYKPGPRFGVPTLQPNGKLPPLPQTVPSPAVSMTILGSVNLSKKGCGWDKEGPVTALLLPRMQWVRS